MNWAAFYTWNSICMVRQNNEEIIDMMRTLIILAAILFTYETASGESTILKLSKSVDKDTVQTFMSFDKMPQYKTQMNGKRLDIILQNTVIDEGTRFFKEDDKIVKILARPVKEDTELSFFFRYIPQNVSFSLSGSNTLVADILLGNRFTGTYKDLSASLQGVTVLDRSTLDFANPLVASPYAHDWKTFFSTYESGVEISAPVRFFIPEFPVSRLLKLPGVEVSQLIPEEAYRLAEKEIWEEITPVIEARIATFSDLQSKKILALTYGEVLLRNGNFDGAYKQLYLLKNNYPKEQVGQLSTYLLSLLIAINGDPYGANYELRLLIDRMRRASPLFAYVNLTLAETSLATNQLDKMSLATERDDIGYPEEIEPKRELRQADLYYATKQPVKAYVAYQLVSQHSSLNDQPYSLNGLCETLYKHKSYEDSSLCYDRLAELIDSRDQLGMVYFRSAMAELKVTDDVPKLINDFSRIEDAFPGTESGFRAALKKTDLRFLSRKDWSSTAVKYYNALAEKSIYREVSAEAYFKEALLYHFSGNNSKSIELTHTLLRNFRSGPIRASAEALLIQLLPAELKLLVEEKKYTEALALARQHRRFFENNWLDISLLADLGYSYHQLGIYNDALRLYLYLMEVAKPEEKEQYYLPLTEIAYDKGDFALVQDYATQYGYHYPDGSFKEEVLYLQLKSLLAENQVDQAINFIPEPLPDRDDYKFLSAELFFRKDAYESVVTILEPFWDQKISLPENLTFILAESLFLQGNSIVAEQVYLESKKVARYSGQSLYRLAEIARENGNERKALQLYADITASENESLWKEFAKRELRLNELGQNL
jgi:hypothetical protein